MRFLLAVVVAAVTAMFGSAAHSAEMLQRGVLIARATQQIVFMSPDSSIEQVSIATGKTEWISRDGAMPIALDGGRLLALRDGAERGKLAYAVIDATDGTLIARAAIGLPAPARSLIDDRLGERFELLVATDGLRWMHQRELVPGASMNDAEGGNDDKQAQTTRLSGALAIDWSTSTLAPIAASSLKSTGALAVEIGPPSATEARTFRSIGDGYRSQSVRLEDGRYRWVLSDVAGVRLGEIVSEYSYRPFDVVDGKLLFVTPTKVSMVKGKVRIDMPTLVAFDLRSGAMAWKREIRDTRYHGPFPS
jgi:hypothetical protein